MSCIVKKEKKSCRTHLLFLMAFTWRALPIKKKILTKQARLEIKEDLKAKKQQGLIRKATPLIPVAIIGSGPAGDSAAIITSRAGFHTIVFKGPKPGGQLMGTTFVENWPGVPRQTGPAIMESLEKQAEHFGALFSSEIIEKIDLQKWPFTLQAQTGKHLKALTVIMATGTSPRKLSVPGESEYWGKGVMACAICDSPFTKGSRVMVVGGFDSPVTSNNPVEESLNAEIIVEQVMQLAVYAREIIILLPAKNPHLCHLLDRRLSQYKQVSVLYNAELIKIVGDTKRVTSAHIQDKVTGEKSTLAIDWLFLATGQQPNTGLVKKQLKLSPTSHIITLCNTQKTTVEGVFAAGNVSNGRYRQASTASGEGVRAGIDALEFLRAGNTLTQSFLEEIRPHFYTPEKSTDQTVPTSLSTIKSLAEIDTLIAEKKDKPLLFFLHSPLCPDCKIVLPIIVSLEKELENNLRFYFVDCTKIPEALERLGIYSIPQCVILKEGKRLASLQLDSSVKKLKLKQLIKAQL